MSVAAVATALLIIAAGARYQVADPIRTATVRDLFLCGRISNRLRQEQRQQQHYLLHARKVVQLVVLYAPYVF